MSRKANTQLRLTRRALADFTTILEYCTEHWGKRSAEKYLADLEAGLERIRQHPDLLQSLAAEVALLHGRLS